jgi:NAD(P)-dependent dehydrogenase (short-subunit alcohol dehydrogenase family)
MATPKTRYPLRGLVTCAGISGVGPTVDFSIDAVRKIVDINLVGTFICAQAAARELVKRNVTGSMVLVASMSAHGSNKVCNAHCGSPKYLSQLTYTAL